MLTIQPVAGRPMPAAAPTAFDPFGDLKREIEEIVADSAGRVFREQQPLIRQTISEAIADQQPLIERTINDVIAEQQPLIRETLNQVIDDQKPELERIADGYITRLKTEIPELIDGEIRKRTDVIGPQVQDIVRSGVKYAAISGSIGALAGFGLGFKAWKGSAGGLLAAAGVGFLGTTAGFLGGMYRASSER